MCIRDRKSLWGTSRFPEYYRKLEDAVKAISGIVMTLSLIHI